MDYSHSVLDGTNIFHWLLSSTEEYVPLAGLSLLRDLQLIFHFFLFLRLTLQCARWYEPCLHVYKYTMFLSPPHFSAALCSPNSHVLTVGLAFSFFSLFSLDDCYECYDVTYEMMMHIR